MRNEKLGRWNSIKQHGFNALGGIVMSISAVLVAAPALADEAKLKSVKIPRYMQAGLNYGGYVMLDKPAPPGGVIVAIASDAEDDIAMPRRILVREGTKSGRFPIHISELARSQFSHIAISDGDEVLRLKARVLPAPALSRTVMQRQVQLRWQVVEN